MAARSTSKAPDRPLRGGKGGNFDGGIRIVAALGGGWLPSNLRGTTSHALTHLADLYATMIDAAGITEDDSSGASSALMPAIDGRSMWPQWLSNQTDERSIVIDASRDVHDGSIGTVVLTQTAGGGQLFKLSTSNLLLCTDHRIGRSPRAHRTATAMAPRLWAVTARRAWPRRVCTSSMLTRARRVASTLRQTLISWLQCSARPTSRSTRCL